MMTFWLLVITVYFTNLAQDKTLDLPEQTAFRDLRACQQAGQELASMLTQDGAEVRWQCVQINQ